MDLPFDETFLSACNISPSRWAHRDVLATLYANLCVTNAQDNLTRIVDERDYGLRHVADSLLIGRAIPEIMTADWRVADVGCGGGFPILPLAWANPALRITGIESRGKKVAFVAEQISKLGFAHADVLAMQSREAGRAPSHAASYDMVLLRAVGAAGDMTREVRGLLRPGPGARIVHYKTPAAIEEEWPVAEREAGKYGMGVEASDVFDLPGDAGTRQFLIMTRQ
jgi:16S rRNA (guanine527-N7)-methyltransferase